MSIIKRKNVCPCFNNTFMKKVKTIQFQCSEGGERVNKSNDVAHLHPYYPCDTLEFDPQKDYAEVNEMCSEI